MIVCEIEIILVFHFERFDQKDLIQLKAAGLFKYVWPFCYHQAVKG